MDCITLLLTFVCFVWCILNKPSGPLVQTKSGRIRGHYLMSYKGNQYEAYQGIPFAEPPIGERRFQSPVPVEPWPNELQTIKIKEVCLHGWKLPSQEPPIGSEDCLYLNVYVPKKRKTNNKLPVIFYIYGGGFRSGGASDGQEHYIIDYDVIFVSANYRAGPFGFLSTEDDVVPGNMGLKDQSTALRWLHDNIEHFGGDPKRIVLVGGSAGAICVHLHYLSPWSRGLFYAGISISGTAFVPAAYARNSRGDAVALGRLVNCTDDDMKRMIECLRSVPAEMLVDAEDQLYVWQSFPSRLVPVIEKSSPDPFIDDYPSEILKKGAAYDVPWVTGIVSEEGLIFTSTYTQNDTLKYIDENWNLLAPLMLDYFSTIPRNRHVSVSQKIRKHYFGDKPIDRENLHALTSLVGDRLFGVGAINAVNAQASANKSPVFLYYYGYRATNSLSDKNSNSTENFGVSHGDDLHLVVKGSRIFPEKSSRDMAMQRRLIQLWTSVAYNGVPDMGIEWPIVTADDTNSRNYLNMTGPDNLKPDSSDNLAQNQFWNSIGFDEK